MVAERRPAQRHGGGAATGVHTTYTVDASAESANGTWTLRVQDVYRFDVGSVTGLTVTF
ncbi:proprotein convertase P-domain-containing protein [Kibdelosporangium lantanae]|uniref:Proprotein convertase P-domain-containing protein n=1 Tax=Kibdelosporangium lantanae TaxID=1497396 RepID=A0ABW3MHM7_9PSEU